MSELVAWLRAQLDEDEASVWPHRPACQMTRRPGLSCSCDAAHRWFQEVEAKRRIIAYAASVIELAAADPGSLVLRGAADAYVSTLRLLALPYADRPGYREEWRPDAQ